MTGGGAPRSISRLASASRRSCTKVHSLAVLNAKRDIVSRMHPPRQTSVWRMLTKYNECAIFKHISNNVCHQFKKNFTKIETIPENKKLRRSGEKKGKRRNCQLSITIAAIVVNNRSGSCYDRRGGDNNGGRSHYDRRGGDNNGSGIINDDSSSSGSDQFGTCSDEIDDIGSETNTAGARHDG